MISLNSKDNKHLLTEKYDLTNKNSFISNVNSIASNIDTIISIQNNLTPEVLTKVDTIATDISTLNTIVDSVNKIANIVKIETDEIVQAQNEIADLTQITTDKFNTTINENIDNFNTEINTIKNNLNDTIKSTFTECLTNIEVVANTAEQDINSTFTECLTNIGIVANTAERDINSTISTGKTDITNYINTQKSRLTNLNSSASTLATKIATATSDLESKLNPLLEEYQNVQTTVTNQIKTYVSDAESAATVSVIDNTNTTTKGNDVREYVKLYVDNDGKLLFGIRPNGSIEWANGIPTPIQNEFNKIAGITTSDLKYLWSVNDTEGKFLFGITVDGNIEWQKGIPTPIQNKFDTIAKTTDSLEYLYTITDNDNKFLFGITINGEIEWTKGVPTPIKDFVNSIISTRELSSIYALVDSEDKLIEEILPNCSRSINGDTTINGNLTINGIVKSLGSSTFCDWSNNSSLKLPIPKCAIIDISGFSRPTTKLDDRQAYLKFWDMQGNYFEKKIIIGLQGNSTWNLPKPNYKFDICNDDWIGDDTFEITFGDWVPQDSFHLKAFYTDVFKGRGIIIYKLYEEICKTRGICADRTWKQALIDPYNHDENTYEYSTNTKIFNQREDIDLRLDTGAKCVPDGFPCIVYLNGMWYGIFTWQIKKQRKNYHMDKKTEEHIHLDGFVGSSGIFDNVASYDETTKSYTNNPSINWGAFEVRNPSDLYTMDGKDYDGDLNRTELIDKTSSYYDKNNKKMKRCASVKQYILNLSLNMGILQYLDKKYQENKTEENKQAIKEQFEKLFDPRNVIDYTIMIDFDKDTDSVSNNCQWTTWDGVKWFLNMYDTNGAFGGNSISGTSTDASHISTDSSYPMYYVQTYYWDDMKTRYKYLRNKNILDANHVSTMLNDWCLSIGSENYEKEMEQWVGMSCWTNSQVDTRYWELIGEETDNPKQTFSYDTSYVVGDEVISTQYYFYRSNTLRKVSTSGYYRFKCIKDCTGVYPILFTSAADNIYRIYYWLQEHINNLDILYEYN